MRHFLALIGGLILTFVLLMVGVRAISATNKSVAIALLDPGNCPQPCWHGIQPGKTTFEQIRTLLRTDNGWFTDSYDQNHKLEWHMVASPGWYGGAYRATSDIDDPDVSYPIQNVQLFFPKGLYKLGDAIALWGEPTTIALYDYGIFEVLFKNHISVRVNYELVTLRIDPSSSLTSVIYNDPNEALDSYLCIQGWYGFTRATPDKFC